MLKEDRVHSDITVHYDITSPSYFC